MTERPVTLLPDQAPEIDMSLHVQSHSMADQFRQNAQDCALLAERAFDDADRTRILTMRKAWLALADNEDWLAGARRPQQTMPGAAHPNDARRPSA